MNANIRKAVRNVVVGDLILDDAGDVFEIVAAPKALGYRFAGKRHNVIQVMARRADQKRARVMEFAANVQVRIAQVGYEYLAA